MRSLRRPITADSGLGSALVPFMGFSLLLDCFHSERGGCVLCIPPALTGKGGEKATSATFPGVRRGVWVSAVTWCWAGGLWAGLQPVRDVGKRHSVQAAERGGGGCLRRGGWQLNLGVEGVGCSLPTWLLILMLSGTRPDCQPPGCPLGLPLARLHPAVARSGAGGARAALAPPAAAQPGRDLHLIFHSNEQRAQDVWVLRPHELLRWVNKQGFAFRGFYDSLTSKERALYFLSRSVTLETRSGC